MHSTHRRWAKRIGITLLVIPFGGIVLLAGAALELVTRPGRPVIVNSSGASSPPSVDDAMLCAGRCFGPRVHLDEKGSAHAVYRCDRDTWLIISVVVANATLED